MRRAVAHLLTTSKSMRLLALCALLVGLPAGAEAQCAIAQDTASRPDVRIFARVRASELRFDTQPRAEVIALGCSPADTVRVLMRTNIPEPITPGTTYRDVEIAIEIVSRLSVVCSPALLELLRDAGAAARLAGLCAHTPTGGNRRP